MRKKQHISSSGLLLDTLCNALGSVLFIALLVIILARVVPLSEEAVEVDPKQEEELLNQLSQLPSSEALAEQITQLQESVAQYQSKGLNPQPTTESLAELIAQRDIADHTTQRELEVAKPQAAATYRIPGTSTTFVDGSKATMYSVYRSWSSLWASRGRYYSFEDFMAFHEDPESWEAEQAWYTLKADVRLGRVKPNKYFEHRLRQEKLELAENPPPPRPETPYFLGVVCKGDTVYITPKARSMEDMTQGQHQHYRIAINKGAVEFVFNREGLDRTTAISQLREIIDQEPNIRVSFTVYPEAVSNFRSVRQGVIDLFPSSEDYHPAKPARTLFWTGIAAGDAYKLQMSTRPRRNY